jgi:N-acetylglucosaminyldiphosphoundecaprenol N-acetyl-beta-D-mannosaminyltransferase
MKLTIGDQFINIISKDDYIKNIKKSLATCKKKTFYYLNSYSFYLANKDETFGKAFNKADYIIADGYSIVLAVKLLLKMKIQKVVFTYTFFESLHKLFALENKRIFLLGTTEDTIKKSAGIIKKQYKDLNIVGYSNGYFDTESQNNKILNQIKFANTDILICGMGMPKTEIWIQENLDKINASCIFSVGGFFDFVAHEKIIAPKWMYNSGFEWIFRLLQEPKRLFKRYLFANSFVFFFILKNKLKNVFK